MTLVKGFAGSEEKTSSKLQTAFARQHRAVNMQSSLVLCAGFQNKNRKLFGNLLPRRGITGQCHRLLRFAKMFDASVLVEHMPKYAKYAERYCF